MDDLSTHKPFVEDISYWFQLKHPDVEQLLGACHVGKRFFLCRGCGDSKELWTALIDPNNAWYVYKKKVIVYSMAWQMLYNAALGLQFLHDRGIVHGNLKSNVVIPDGNIIKTRAINGSQNLEYNHKDASWEPVKTPWWEWRPSNRPANFSGSQWEFLKTLVCEGPQERVTVTEVIRLLKVFAREEKVFGRRRSGAAQLPVSECEHVAKYIMLSKQKPIRLLLDSIKTNLTNCGATSPATPSASMCIFRRLADVYLKMTRMSMSHIMETNMLALLSHPRAIPRHGGNKIKNELFDRVSRVKSSDSWRTQWSQDQRAQTKLLSSIGCEQIQSAQDDSDSDKVQDECLAYLLFEYGQRRSRYSTTELGDLKRATEAIFQGPASTDQSRFIPPCEAEFDENPFQSGGFGEVYLGRRLDANVVVKKLKQDDAQSHQSFFNEVNIWYQLNHPNVVKLFGACHAEINRSYTWHRLCDAVNGLKYLHKRGIVHGDLKCDNILVGTDGLAKLTDFGFSIFKFDDNTSTKTAGAVNWMAPEMLKGESPTFTSDVYSFGMCVIEAVSDECPWPSAASVKIKREVKRDLMPNRPKQFRDDGRFRHTDHAWKIVQQMCYSAPEKRLEMDKVVDSMVLLSKDKSRTLRRPQRTTKQPDPLKQCHSEKKQSNRSNL